MIQSRHALVLSLALSACASKMPAFRAACEAGSADACEIVAARLMVGTDGPPNETEAASFGKRAYEMRMKACAAGGTTACDKLRMRGTFVASLPLDQAKPPPAPDGGELQTTLGVELHADGAAYANGKRLADDDAVLTAAREALQANPELRAVIRADTQVTHGRVIRVLDLLKQAGITKIAFGVAPVPPKP